MAQQTVTAIDGDTLCTLAISAGFPDCTPLRALAENAAFLKGFLNPGDKVTIPDRNVANAGKPTDATHRFKRKGRQVGIRFVHGSKSRPFAEDIALTTLNVSNYQTDMAGQPDGAVAFVNDTVRQFDPDAHLDEDTFKVEVLDTLPPGDPIDVRVQALRPQYSAADATGRTVTGHIEFAGAVLAHRRLDTKASKQGATHRFRTCYLRLVSDEFDNGTSDGQGRVLQTVLVTDMTDQGDAQVEILDQLIEARYELTSCPAAAKCHVRKTATVGKDRRRMRVAVHILRTAPGAAPVATIADVQRRINKWLRRGYAQMAISPRVMQIRIVDPVANLVSVSDNTGLTAAGDGQLGFQITAPGKATVTVGPITPAAGARPMATASTLAGLVTAPYSAVASENPARFPDPVNTQSADILITEASGAAVTITITVAGDSRQTLAVGRPNINAIVGWDGTNWLVGSLDHRTLLKNYDSGDDRVDIVVIGTYVAGTNNQGEAQMSGHLVDAQRRAKPKVKWSLIIEGNVMGPGDSFPYACAHEIGHALMEVVHPVGADGNVALMNHFWSPTAAVAGHKRIRDGLVLFDLPARQFNQVRAARSEGGPLLENW
jgi:hypothetical protein